MMLRSCLLCDTVQLTADQRVLILNSAADPFVLMAEQQINKSTGEIVLAEDSITNWERNKLGRYVAFHEYTLYEPPATMDVAVTNLLYQPSNAWMLYGLKVATYTLKVAGRLYLMGAKDRGILSMAKRMEEQFGNVETLAIHKGHRVLCSRKMDDLPDATSHRQNGVASLIPTFAVGKLDEGTRLLLEALEVRVTDQVLDIGCGAGFIGISIARRATKGHVTMVDASLAAVASAKQAVEQNGLTNVRVLPSDGPQAVLSERFDLVVTNPPFHLGGIQTTEIAERFIREAAQVLRPRGRFYLVANRFLKYEPTLRACFKMVEEVGGDKRYKVLRALN